MSVHFQHQIERLKKDVLSLGTTVEEQVQMAVRALLDRDEEMARQVERRDMETDQHEIEIEEECLKTLALYQPVAGDLRFIVSALKINNDLERIGDMAVNIARKALSLIAMPSVDIPFDLAAMSEKAQDMLRDSLDAMVNQNAKLASSVCARDDDVDRMKREIRVKAEEMIRRDPSRLAPLLNVLAVSRNLERIADHATNIAEDVVYLVEGRIIRHGHGD